MRWASTIDLTAPPTLTPIFTPLFSLTVVVTIGTVSQRADIGSKYLWAPRSMHPFSRECHIASVRRSVDIRESGHREGWNHVVILAESGETHVGRCRISEGGAYTELVQAGIPEVNIIRSGSVHVIVHRPIVTRQSENGGPCRQKIRVTGVSPRGSDLDAVP